MFSVRDLAVWFQAVEDCVSIADWSKRKSPQLIGRLLRLFVVVLTLTEVARWKAVG